MFRLCLGLRKKFTQCLLKRIPSSGASQIACYEFQKFVKRVLNFCADGGNTYKKERETERETHTHTSKKIACFIFTHL